MSGPNLGAAFRKLTPEQVVELRRDFDSGLIRGKALGKKYGLSRSGAEEVARRVNYKWVPEE